MGSCVTHTHFLSYLSHISISHFSSPDIPGGWHRRVAGAPPHLSSLNSGERHILAAARQCLLWAFIIFGSPLWCGKAWLVAWRVAAARAAFQTNKKAGMGGHQISWPIPTSPPMPSIHARAGVMGWAGTSPCIRSLLPVAWHALPGQEVRA